MTVFRKRRIRNRAFRSTFSVPIHLKKRHVVLFLIIGIPIFILWFVNRMIYPSLISYAETHTKKIAVMAISEAIEDVSKKELDKDKLINVTADKNGKIATIDFDAIMINRFLAELTKNVEEKMKVSSLEKIAHQELGQSVTVNTKEHEMVLKVPLGMATGNALLGNIGPKIPITFHVIGDIVTDVNKSIQPYGVNNALVDIGVRLEANLKVVIPFETKLSQIKMDVPITMRVIQGEVPSYYHGGGNNGNSMLPSVPIEGSKKP